MVFIKKNKKYIGVIACLISIVGTFLKFASISGYGYSASTKYVDGKDGIIVLVAMAISMILFFVNKNKKPIYVLLILALGITIYDGLNGINSLSKTVSLYTNEVKIGLGIGFYLILIGIIIAFIMLILKGDDTKESNSEVYIQNNNQFNRMYAQEQRQLINGRNIFANQMQNQNQNQPQQQDSQVQYNSQGFPQSKNQPQNNNQFNSQGFPQSHSTQLNSGIRFNQSQSINVNNHNSFNPNNNKF